MIYNKTLNSYSQRTDDIYYEDRGFNQDNGDDDKNGGPWTPPTIDDGGYGGGSQSGGGGQSGGDERTPYLPKLGDGLIINPKVPGNPIQNKTQKISGVLTRTSTESLELLSFAVYTKSNGYIGKCRIEMEFYHPTPLARGKCKFIDMITQPNGDLIRDVDKFCFNKDVNFDDETLNNFTIVVKDWDVGDNEIAMMASTYLPQHIIDDGYSAAIFILTKNNGIIKKSCIGTLSNKKIKEMIKQ